MIPEFGQFALILALGLAFVQATVPLYGAWRGHVQSMRLARFTALGQFAFVGFAFSALAYAFLTNDFSVTYVANNSNTNLPAMYRFCAIWSAHEGSILLWIFILTIWTAAVAVFSRSLPLDMIARVLAVLGMICIGFYVFLLTSSDPFSRMLPNMPLNGADINPILQDPGLAIHPPMLYMGYVGFSVAFAFAIAALMSGKLDSVWARWSKPWTLIAWSFLTFGIVLGSWWAYRELGWGGWWFWDPVENASFLPWLVATALVHSLSVTEKRNVFKAWTVLLAVCAFSLSLLGTFLVRSGVLISVHAFAVDPKRGMYLLRFLAIVVGASLVLYAWRGRKIVNTGSFQFLSRETMLLANNIVLFIGMVTVLLGTLYPLFINALGLAKISVGAPYFNAVFVPLMVPMLVLIGIGPYFRWQQMSIKHLWLRLGVIFIISLALALILPRLTGASETFGVVLGLLLAFWVIINTTQHIKKNLTRSQWGMIFAHIGLGVTVIGLVLASAYSQSKNLSVTPGQVVSVGPYQFKLQTVSGIKGSDFNGIQGSVEITKDGEFIGELYPQLRNFPVQQMTTSKTAINVGVFRDLYVAIGNSLPGGAWSMRVYYKPFIRWIWAGGLLMVVGGLCAVSDRRYRRKKSMLKSEDDENVDVAQKPA